MNKKVISFSLYGNNPKYFVGMKKNAELAKAIFPDWEVWVHHCGVDNEHLAPIEALGAKLINMAGTGLPCTFWRMLPSVDRFIVRDADSRLSLREKLAVDEWITSGKRFHVMKDHPHHKQLIMGGMWGITIGDYDIEPKAIEWCKRDGVYGMMNVRNTDQRFLREIIYPYFCHDMMVHESIWPTIAGSLPFPTPMIDGRFIGEIYDENDNRDFQYGLLTDEWRG